MPRRPRWLPSATRLLRWGPGVLAGLWLLVQWWVLRHGPVVLYDSHRYLGYARQLAAGGGLGHPHNQRYLGYALYLAPFVLAGAGPWAMVLGQMLLNGLGTAAYYVGLRRLGGERAALAATAAVVLWLDLQHYNACLLTESLFTSALLLSVGLVSRVPQAGWRALVALLVAAALIRPNGFIGLVALGGAAALQAWRRANRSRRLALLAIGLAAWATLWGALNYWLGTYHLIETYARGALITGYDVWRIRPPAPLEIPSPTLPPLVRALTFVANQPLYFAKLAGAKLALFALHAKPYFTGAHNTVLLLVLPAAWVLAVRGATRRRVPAVARQYLLGLLLAQALITMLTVEDWNGRFLIPLLPALFGLASFNLTARR